MRPLALLAAITIMHTVHAIPRPYLAVQDVVNDLSNDKHVFHHLDRNQRTAGRDRERSQAENAEGMIQVAKRLVDELQRAGRRTTEESVERRFMRTPDYSESEGGGNVGHSGMGKASKEEKSGDSHGHVH